MAAWGLPAAGLDLGRRAGYNRKKGRSAQKGAANVCIKRKVFGMKLSSLLLVGAPLLAAWLVAPGKSKKNQCAPFMGLNVAHRGLHTADCSRPENSLSAFDAAAAGGYGIELDVQLSRDGEVVVFHDDTLDRVCGVHGRVDSYTLAQLQGMRLCGTSQTIPTLAQVLELLDGRAPLIVELKTGPRNRQLCRKTLRLLRGYAGAWCIESFDPRIVAWFRRNAPDVLRGQLADAPASYKSKGPLAEAVLGNLLGNVIARPQFIAWGEGKKPALVRFCEWMGVMKVRWTVRPADDRTALEGEYDAIIFEYETPPAYYR